jgi:hypothetical protein
MPIIHPAPPAAADGTARTWYDGEEWTIQCPQYGPACAFQPARVPGDPLRALIRHLQAHPAHLHLDHAASSVRVRLPRRDSASHADVVLASCGARTGRVSCLVVVAAVDPPRAELCPLRCRSVARLLGAMRWPFRAGLECWALVLCAVGAAVLVGAFTVWKCLFFLILPLVPFFFLRVLAAKRGGGALEANETRDSVERSTLIGCFSRTVWISGWPGFGFALLTVCRVGNGLRCFRDDVDACVSLGSVMSFFSLPLWYLFM